MTRIEITIKELEAGHVSVRSRCWHGVKDAEPSELEKRTTAIASKAIHQALVECRDFQTCEEVEP